MSAVSYPLRVRLAQHGVLTAHFPDFPDAPAFSVTEAEMMRQAQVVLRGLVLACRQEGRPLPRPSEGWPVVTVIG